MAANKVVNVLVRLNGTADGVAGVTVTVTDVSPISRTYGQVWTGVTGTDGKYLLENLESTFVDVVPEKAGYVFSPLADRWLGTTDLISGVIAMFFAQPSVGSGSIAGRVSSGGRGIGGIGVVLNSTIGSFDNVPTDGNGFYAFKKLSQATYRVFPTQLGLTFTPAARENIAIANNDVTGMDFTVDTLPVYSISGRITLGTTGLPGIEITAAGTHGFTGLATSDGTGQFSIANLPADLYKVYPSSASFSFTPSEASISISSNNVTGVNFSGVYTAADLHISGSVTQDSSALPRVTIALEAPGISLFVLTKADGKYDIGNLPGGTYTLTPSRRGYGFTPAVATVALVASSATRDFTAVQAITYTILGRIGSFMDPGGSGLANVRVSLNGGNRTTLTDQYGMFKFSDLPGGTHVIVPVLSGYFFKPESKQVTLAGVVSPWEGVFITAHAVVWEVGKAGVLELPPGGPRTVVLP